MKRYKLILKDRNSGASMVMRYAKNRKDCRYFVQHGGSENIEAIAYDIIKQVIIYSN